VDQATHNRIVSNKPQPLRTLAEIGADILAIEKEAEGLLDGLLMGATQP